MWPGNMGWMGPWMVFWWIGGLVVLILLVWIVARAAGGPAARTEETPERILKRRYARGEIDREDYERRLDDLRK
jgi:putative membrane protein